MFKKLKVEKTWDLTAIRGGKFGSGWIIYTGYGSGRSQEIVTIGLVPEHPGIWLTHCHILEHAEAGLKTTIEVKN